MRSYPIVAVAAVAALLAGCSSGSDGADSPSSSSASVSAATPTTTTLQTHTAAPGAVGVSPNGVTTAVGAPAESTEDEYFQACRAAKVWMLERGGDQKTQFEPYLESLQKSDAAGPGTFDAPWSRLTPARQSAVIVAAEAAADDLCG
ncbi:MAG TPA: lipoprotein LpqV [Mycobacterium sp.]|nr:lipoprotein LpqV [Mycobacterium sp.]